LTFCSTEAIIGQFSSRGSVKVYDYCPLFRGIGFGQVLALTFAASYYGGVMALISSYLVDSFKNPLPWMFCRPEWTNCVNSSVTNSINQLTNNSTALRSSAELYFL
jgi:solute carrier family 6 (neurotransmitter transporter, glycine) member 5/9